MPKKIINPNKNITKKYSGLFLDCFKHLKVNLSTLLEHFRSIDFYDHQKILNYLNAVPNNRKAKFPDMKKLGLINYTKQERPDVSIFGKNILEYQSKQDLAMLVLNYSFEGDVSMLRPYYILLEIIYQKNITTLNKNQLNVILSTPIIEILQKNVSPKFYDLLDDDRKEEILRPQSYICNYLQCIEAVDSENKVNMKKIVEYLELVSQPMVDFINNKNYYDNHTGRPAQLQQLFKNDLQKIYKNKCFIRNQKLTAKRKNKEYPLLDAAHIIPFSKGGSFSVNNGILLSFDLHRYFDMGLMTIKFENGKFFSMISSKINDAGYITEFNHKALPHIKDRYSPNLLALEYHNKAIFNR